MSDESQEESADHEAENASESTDQQFDRESLERFDESVGGMSKMKKEESAGTGEVEELPGEGGGIGSSVSGAGNLRKGSGKKGGSSTEETTSTEEGPSEKSGDQNGES